MVSTTAQLVWLETKSNNKLGKYRAYQVEIWIENVAGKSSCYDIFRVITQDIRKGI